MIYGQEIQTVHDLKTPKEAHDISSFVHKMNSESSPAMSFILFYLAYGIFVGK